MTFNPFSKPTGAGIHLLQSLAKTKDSKTNLLLDVQKKYSNHNPILFEKENDKSQPSQKLELENKNTLQKIKTMHTISQIKKIIPKIIETSPLQLKPPNIQNQPQFQASNEIIQSYRDIVNALNLIYQIIRGNNQQILMKIKRTDNRIKENHCYILRRDQLNRLQQGLSFYFKNEKQNLKILQIGLKKHIFGPLVQKVCGHFDLDELKAFYLVKQIHKRNKIIKQPSSFFINMSKQNIIPQSQALKYCQIFLLQDKKNLINCYLQILKYENPSKRKVMQRESQYTILYRNLNKIQLQTIQMKEFLITLFQCFWHNSSQTQRNTKGNQLNEIRKRLMNLNVSQSYKIKLSGLNIDELLENKQLSPNVLQGPYKDLYYIMVQNNDTFILHALDSSYINNLSLKWGPYIQEYLKKVQFNSNKEHNIMKAVYICNILKCYINNKGTLPMQLLQNLVTLILNDSIILAILVLNSFQIQSKYLYFMTIIFDKYNEFALCQMIKKQEDLLKYYEHGEKIIDISLIASIQIQIVKKTIKKFILFDDIQGLQRQLVSYGVESLLDFQFSKRFNCIRYYFRMIHLLPSQHLQINRDGLEILAELKRKGQEIQLSLSDFVNRLINYTKDIQIIEQNILTLPKISCQQKFICKQTIKWFMKMQDNNMEMKMKNFNKILNMICERWIQYQYEGYEQVFDRGIKLFERNILDLLNGVDGLQKICDIYYCLSRLQQWKGEQSMFLVSLTSRIQDYLWKQQKIKSVIQSQLIEVHLKIYISSLFQTQKSLNIIKQLIPCINPSLPYYITIDLLSALLHTHKQLFPLIIKKTIIPLHNLLKVTPSINYLSLKKLIHIGMQLGLIVFYESNNLTKQQSMNSTSLILLINYSCILKFKNKIIDSEFYSKVINLLSICNYMIQYKFHIYWLKMGLDLSLLYQVKFEDQNMFIQYAYYVTTITICMKFNKIIDLKGEFNIQFYLKLFHTLGKMILQINWSEIDELQTFQKIQKTIKSIILFYMKSINIQNLKEDVYRYVNYIYQHIKLVIQKYPFTKLKLINFIDKIQKQLPQREIFIEGNSSKGRVYLCENSQQFQEQINKCFWLLVDDQLNFDNYKKVHQTIKKWLKNNDQYKINKFNVTQCILNFKSIPKQKIQGYCQYFLATLEMSNTLIKKKRQNFSYRDCKKPFAFIFWNITQMTKDIKCTSFQTILAITSILNTYNYILRNNMLSALHFTRKQKMMQYINFIIKEIIDLLPKWQKMPEDLLRQNRKLFFIDFRWKFMNEDKCFTLWNLIQYNQKLLMINQILILLKLLNGYLQYDNNLLKVNVVQFLQLYCVKRQFNRKLLGVIQLNKRSMDWYQFIQEVNGESMQKCGFQIYWHLNRLWQLQQDEILSLQCLENQIYIWR